MTDWESERGSRRKIYMYANEELEALLAEGMANEEREEAKVVGIDANEVVTGGSETLPPEELEELSDGSEGSADLEEIHPGEVYTESTETETGPDVEEFEGSIETYPESVCFEDFMQADEQLEIIHGSDDRTRIYATRSLPWRTICKLEITAANGRRFGCSGAFIGPRTVLTNGHCVYMHSQGGWARNIRVIPGMNGASRPYGHADSTLYHSVKGWTQRRSSNYDYAVVVLPSNRKLGNRVGWMGLANLPLSTLMGLRVNSAGYPGDKPYGTQWWNGNNILAVTSRRVYYRIDTMNGQSGSPVWRYRNGSRHIVAVHNTGGATFNGSVRINREVFNNLIRAKNGYT
jgi:V8-like Glu-specific endopeptidase